jgi:hypothetical protein
VQAILRTGEDRASLAGGVADGDHVLERLPEVTFERLRLLLRDVRPDLGHRAIASGLTEVAPVPALWTSNLSPARWRSSPSAICERAELWVHKKSTLGCLSATLTAAMFVPTRGVERKVSGRLTQRIAGGFSVERIEAPLPALLFPDEAGLP